MGKCTGLGTVLDDDARRALAEARESGAPSQEVDRILLDAITNSRTFYPREQDFAELIVYLAANDTNALDAFAQTATETREMMTLGVQNMPSALSVLGKHRPEYVASGLMLFWRDALDASGHDSDRFSRWRSHNDLPLPSELNMPAAVADGVARGTSSVVARTTGRGEVEAPPADPRTRIVAELTELTSPEMRRLQNQRDGVRSRLRETIQAHPEAWYELLPWAIQLLGESGIPAQATGWTMAVGRNPGPTLRSVIASGTQPVADRARSILGMLEGEYDQAAALSRLAQETDARRSPFPRPLSQPTATWLSDLEIEEGLRSAVSAACRVFADDFAPGPDSEEEGHVTGLLTRMNAEIGNLRSCQAVTNQIVAADLLSTFRIVPKHEEKDVHADVALVVRIDAPGSLRGVYADFVQVKKAKRKDVSSAPDTWSIKVDQLIKLLRTSPTAVYWLIENSGQVRVVPAKVLHAIADGTARLENGVFTIHYSDVRHTMINLDSYMVDLMTGGWLGSSDPGSVALATGSSGRNGARVIFELTIRRELDDAN
jgi:hypothetical protein